MNNITLATKITLIRVIIIPLLMFTTYMSTENYYLWIISLVLFAFGSFTDWLDGYIARSKNQITKLGKFLDQLADKAFITGVLCVLVYLRQSSFWLLATIVIRDTAVSGVRMLAASTGNVIAANWWGKSKTVVQMVYVMIIMTNLYSNWIPFSFVLFLELITIFMTIISGITYFKGVKDLF